MEETVVQTTAEQLEQDYIKACDLQQHAIKPKDFAAAAEAFEMLGNYKAASIRAAECRETAEGFEKEQGYVKACKQAKSAQTSAELHAASKAFEALTGYKDSEEQAKNARKKQIRPKQRARR